MRRSEGYTHEYNIDHTEDTSSFNKNFATIFY